MGDERVEQLFREAIARGWSRRRILQAGAAAGLVLPLSAAVGRGAAAQDTSNPLGVDPAAPLDVVIFKGGYGDEYAIYVNDQLYKKLYPDAQITYAGIQRLGEQLQPRFVAGNPPDVIDNSGAGNLSNPTLAAEGQLADLADLMAAPAYDTPGATFADSLVPGSQVTGEFDGTQYLLNWALTVYGLWYSEAFMATNELTYPQTWEEMLTLGEELKGQGIALFGTTGVHPQYLIEFMLNQMIWKRQPAALFAIDNLEADAWKAPAVAEVLTALRQIPERDLMMSGWDGLDHVQSQNEWLQGKAAFLPCGTWLENEMADSIPEGFNMAVAPIPSLPGDEVPFAGIFAGAGEPFIVPAQGKNVAGGKEWLRLLFSKEGGRKFSELTKSLSVVIGSGDGLDLGTAFASTQKAITDAGANTTTARYPDWYPGMRDEMKPAMASLMTLEMSVEEFQQAAQDIADATKDDPGIVKYTRT